MNRLDRGVERIEDQLSGASGAEIRSILEAIRKAVARDSRRLDALELEVAAFRGAADALGPEIAKSLAEAGELLDGKVESINERLDAMGSLVTTLTENNMDAMTEVGEVVDAIERRVRALEKGR